MKNNTAQLKQDYNRLTSLYEEADALLATLASAPQAQQGEYFRAAAPLAVELEAAGDVLTAGFIQCAEGKIKQQKKGIESALRKAFSALDSYRRDITTASVEVAELLSSHVERVQEALGKAVAAFAEFVDLAVDRIMQKSDLDALRKREPKIALMLQQLAATNAPARS